MARLKLWFKDVFGSPEPNVSRRSPVIIPREVTPLDLRYEENP